MGDCDKALVILMELSPWLEGLLMQVNGSSLLFIGLPLLCS